MMLLQACVPAGEGAIDGHSRGPAGAETCKEGEQCGDCARLLVGMELEGLNSTAEPNSKAETLL